MAEQNNSLANGPGAIIRQQMENERIQKGEDLEALIRKIRDDAQEMLNGFDDCFKHIPAERREAFKTLASQICGNIDVLKNNFEVGYYKAKYEECLKGSH